MLKTVKILARYRGDINTLATMVTSLKNVRQLDYPIAQDVAKVNKTWATSGHTYWQVTMTFDSKEFDNALIQKDIEFIRIRDVKNFLEGAGLSVKHVATTEE